MKEAEMSGVCSMHGRDKKAMTFLIRQMMRRDHLGDLGYIDKKIIIKCNLKNVAWVYDVDSSNSGFLWSQ